MEYGRNMTILNSEKMQEAKADFTPCIFYIVTDEYTLSVFNAVTGIPAKCNMRLNAIH